MKKILLPGMMAALAFAACTNEEIVSQQTAEAPKADLSNRPVVGMVDLNFGPQTRATMGENFNDIVWEADKDKIGARIIDNLTGNQTCHAVHNYTIDGDYAWSNYRYDYKDGGNWTSDALMVEGNYMFYAPYDEAALYRTPLMMKFPTVQTVSGLEAVKNYTEGGKGGNTSAIEEFYGNLKGQTVVVGHTFLSEADGGQKVTPQMAHLYAYPLFTIVNEYEEALVDENGDPKLDPETSLPIVEAQPITIDQITIESNKVFANYKIKQIQLVEALRLGIEAYDKNNDGDTKDAGEHAAVNYDNWASKGVRSGWFLKNAQTSKIAEYIDTTPEKDEVDPDGKITVNLDEPLTIPAGYGVKLNVVMPAEEYAQNQIKINVRVVTTDKEGKTVYKKFNANAEVFDGDGYSESLLYATSKQIPAEEYNIDSNDQASAKKSWGTLATFKLQGALVDMDAVIVDPEGIDSNSMFYAWLETIADNSTSKYEKVFDANGEELDNPDADREGDFRLASDHKLVFNQELVDSVSKFLNDAKAKIYFVSPLNVAGGTTEKPLEINGAKYPNFGKLTIESGKVILNGVNVAELVIKSGATIELKGNTTIGKISEVNGDVVLNGATLTAADDSKGITFKGTANLTNVTVKSKAIFEKAATINGGSFAGVEFKAGASLSGAITTTDGSKATVSGGDVVAGNSTGWATVNLFGGSMKITNKAYAPTVNIGRAKGVDGAKADQDGTLTAAAAEGLTLPAVTLNTAKSKLDIDNDLTIDAGKLTWTKGSIENSAKFTYALTVPAGNTYTHNAGAEVVGTLTNNGNIENYGTLAVVNNADVKAMNASSRTTVSGSSNGYVNNTKLGVVINEGTNQTVYIETGAFTNDDIYESLDLSHAVNTLYINGVWTVSENMTTVLPTGLTLGKIVFRAGGSLALGSATLNFNNIPVEIDANQTWTGRLSTVSKIENLSNITFNADEDGKYYTLTTTEINMGTAYAAAYSTAIAEAIAAGGSVKLINDVALTESCVVTEDTEIDFNGKTIALTNVTGTHAAAIKAESGKVTIKNAKIDCQTTGDATTSCIAVWAKGDADVTIENGDFAVVGENSCIYVSEATAKITIKGGTYNAGVNHKFLLNQKNDINKQCIFVEGGTFVNFNPANAKNDDTWATGNANENINFVNANKVVSVYYGESLLSANTTTAYTETDWCTDGKNLTYKVVAKQ